MELSPQAIGLAGVALFTLLLTILNLRRSRQPSVKIIPGPSPSSWVYGNMRELVIPSDYGHHEYQWQAKYGPLYRIKGCFGEDRLMISDPATIKFVLGDPVTFIRSPQQQQIVRMLLGEGSLLYADAVDQRRFRAVMNPAFSASNVRALPSLLHTIASQLTDQWKLSCTQGVLDVSPSLHHATLDAIGVAVLGAPFNTLENNDSELARSYHNLVPTSSSRSNTSILVDGIMRYIPSSLMRLALLLPTAALRRLRHNRNLTARLATELIDAKTEVLRHGLEGEKDLLSLLVNANATTNAAKKMNAVEMRDQIPTAMVAGQESTATTISWTLYELAKDASSQEMLRAEIQEAYAAVRGRGDNELSYRDLEGMTYLNAFLKEVLRVYAALPMSEREAVKDAVLPLSQPITTITGDRITELPVKKGQFLVVATASYHRSPLIWGQDAHVFRANRWLETNMPKGGSLGPYGNLLTFLGGPRTCIGWRFALTEMQVFIIEIVRQFTFSIPEGIEMRQGLAVTLVPVTGEGIGTQCLPLNVSSLE